MQEVNRIRKSYLPLFPYRKRNKIQARKLRMCVLPTNLSTVANTLAVMMPS